MIDPAPPSNGLPDPGDHGIQAEGPRPTRARTSHVQARSSPLGPAPPPPRSERSTEFFGREFRLDRGRPYAGFLFAIGVSVIMGVLSTAVTRAYWQFGLAYGLLIAVCGVAFFSRSNPRRVRFTADGIETTRPDERLAYDKILEIHTPDRKRRAGRNFAIHLLHARGYLTIPPAIRADSQDLLEFLAAQPLGTRAVPEVPPILRDFVKQQLSVHGADEVYVYRARQGPQPRYNLGSGLWPLVAFLAAGVGLAAIGLVHPARGFIVAGIGVAVFGAFACLLSSLQHRFARVPIKDWRQAMLVIGPDGLALVQGDLTGELRWRELKSAKLAKGAATTAGGRRNVRVPGIELQVAGAAITIADIYHWPLTHALEQIERHRHRGSRE